MGYYLGKILYGSQNYGLDLPTSDKDYKIIVAPSLIDLYKGEELTKKLNEHETQMDVRKFARLLLERGNLNMWELVFSIEKEGKADFLSLLKEVRANSQQLLLNAFDGFINSWKGMSFQVLNNKDARKGTSRALFLIELGRRLATNAMTMTEETWNDYLPAVEVREGLVAPSRYSYDWIKAEVARTEETLRHCANELTVIPDAYMKMDKKFFDYVIQCAS